MICFCLSLKMDLPQSVLFALLSPPFLKKLVKLSLELEAKCLQKLKIDELFNTRKRHQKLRT